MSTFFRAMHWGYNPPVNTTDDAGAALWLQARINGRLRVIGELGFQRLSEAELAQEILAKDRALRISDHISYTVGSPEIFPKRRSPAHFKSLRGEYIYERLSAHGVCCIPADPDVVNGFARVHALLRPNLSAEPWLTIDPSCTGLIKAMASALSDDTHPDDLVIASPFVTALRYAAMSRPSPDVAETTPADPIFGTPAYYMKQLREAEAGTRTFGRAR